MQDPVHLNAEGAFKYAARLGSRKREEIKDQSKAKSAAPFLGRASACAREAAGYRVLDSMRAMPGAQGRLSDSARG